MAENKTAEQTEKEFEAKAEPQKEIVSKAFIEKASLVADLLAIKMNNLFAWYHVAASTITDATSTTMYSNKVEHGYLRVLTHVSAKEATNIPGTIEIAIERGGQAIILNRDVPSAVNISVDYDGQAILIGGDRVKVTFYGGTSANVIDISCSGYEIKA